MSFTSVTVTGTFREPDDLTPAKGHVEFQLTNDMTDSDGQRILARTKRRVVLDDAGAFSTVLAATNDPSTNPQGTLYLVTESIVGTPTRTFYMEVLYSSISLDLASVTPIPSGAVLVTGPPGPPGTLFSTLLGEDGVPTVAVISNYGIDGMGRPYYDPSGAQFSETAILEYIDGAFTLVKV